MDRIIILIFILLMHLSAAAQQAVQERVKAQADQRCYVVNEHLKLNVAVTLPDGSPSPSKVAYVEIADTAQQYAQAMIALDDGRGYAEVPLPPTMHSGTYQLCVYTRGLRNFGEQAFFTTRIGVINPVKLSLKDNIRFLPADDGDINVSLDPATNYGSLIDLSHYDFPFAYEVEGHIVTANVSAEPEDVENVRFALVGKTTMIYDGRISADGNYEFYTTGIYGDQPSLVSAYNNEGKSLSTAIVSPYAQVMPLSLPQLTISCSEQTLKERYERALRQKAIDEWHHNEPLTRTGTFMSSKPQRVYDLDEWTTMSTVREMLTEFISGVSVGRSNGMQQLYTYSQCPALVLFDGIPIYDVQRFLDYDARLLKYVQIYDDIYTFGQSYCYGVVSFISRSGKLPNYTLDEGSTFVSYPFPRANPSTTE